MRIAKPYYFDSFRCLAGSCPDSCCKEWEVQVDGDAAARYRSLSGDLGDRLRQVLRDEDGQTYMTIEEGRCPMWRQDGLCRIQAELGEGALCRTCREFPRLTHDYGDFIEYGLELSCPEAARYILNASPLPFLESRTEEPGEAEYDEDAMDSLKSTRTKALALLSEEGRSPEQALALLLLYSGEAQSELDGYREEPFDTASAMDTALQFARPATSDAMLEFFLTLEMLTDRWETLLRSPSPSGWDRRHLALARYLTERYWLQAISDYDLYCRVKLIVISCLLVKTLGGNLEQTAQLFSKEIENNTDNVDALLDAAYSHPAFTDDKLLGMLLRS